MAKPLSLDALDHIDRLAAFYVTSKENAELLEVITSVIAVSDVNGAGVVLARRIVELEKEAERASA